MRTILGLVLMNEWMKFRFGVFNERRGFKNDSIYRFNGILFTGLMEFYLQV